MIEAPTRQAEHLAEIRRTLSAVESAPSAKELRMQANKIKLLLSLIVTDATLEEKRR